MLSAVDLLNIARMRIHNTIVLVDLHPGVEDTLKTCEQEIEQAIQMINS